MIYTDTHCNYDGACIYKLIFGTDFYIGSTIDLKKRIKAHCYNMRSGKSSIKLNDAWSKYKKFEIEILEYIDEDKPRWYLHSRESYWIDKLNPSLNASDVTGGKTEKDAEYIDYLNMPVKKHRVYKKHNWNNVV